MGVSERHVEIKVVISIVTQDMESLSGKYLVIYIRVQEKICWLLMLREIQKIYLTLKLVRLW